MTVFGSGGIYTFSDEAGVTITTIDTNADAITFDPANAVGVTATEVQTAIEELASLIDAIDETTTTLTDHGDGTFTYTNELGDDVTFDANTLNVAESGGIYTFSDEAGVTIITIDTNADAITFDPANAVAALFRSVQTAIEELASLIDAIDETTTTLTDHGDGTFTYTNELGDDVTFDA